MASFGSDGCKTLKSHDNMTLSRSDLKVSCKVASGTAINL